MIPDKLIAAKMVAFNRRPYYGRPLNALVMVESPGLGTFAVDKYWRCYWDPQAVNDWSVEEIAGVLTHEIGHPMRDHHPRSERYGLGLDATRWNFAADMEINDDMISEVFLTSRDGHMAGDPLTPLPNFEGQSMPLCPKMYGFKDGQFAETYYDLLEDQSEKGNKKLKQMQDATGQAGAGDATKGKCGSCCSGKAKDYEAPAPDDNDESIPPGLNETEAELIKRETAHDMQDYKDAQDRIGNLPAGLERWAENYLTSKVNYLAWIRAAIRHAYTEASGRTEYTWKRPSRRRNYGRFKMPGMQTFLPKIGVIVDTSGSMSDTQASQALAEVAGVIRQSACDEVIVASCDAAAYDVQRITSVKDIKLMGGGGTDMGVGLATLEAIKPRRDLMILLTDCETPWPAKRPRGAIVIIQIGGSGSPPPWPCHHVKITPGEPMDGGIKR